jgi:hypothetical protein
MCVYVYVYVYVCVYVYVYVYVCVYVYVYVYVYDRWAGRSGTKAGHQRMGKVEGVCQ